MGTAVLIGWETPLHCKKKFPIFPPRESLVSDIPAGDGKIVKLFYSVLSPSPHPPAFGLVHEGAIGQQR